MYDARLRIPSLRVYSPNGKACMRSLKWCGSRSLKPRSACVHSAGTPRRLFSVVLLLAYPPNSRARSPQFRQAVSFPSALPSNCRLASTMVCSHMRSQETPAQCTTTHLHACDLTTHRSKQSGTAPGRPDQAGIHDALPSNCVSHAWSKLSAVHEVEADPTLTGQSRSFNSGGTPDSASSLQIETLALLSSAALLDASLSILNFEPTPSSRAADTSDRETRGLRVASGKPAKKSLRV
eukprot:1353093-Pleurochrysis_carterae.AAC.2